MGEPAATLHYTEKWQVVQSVARDPFNLPDRVPREAYSHEVSSCGFSPGGGPIAYPEPERFAKAAIKAASAFYSTDLREFIFPYEVRNAPSPENTLLDFTADNLRSTGQLSEMGSRTTRRAEVPIKEGEHKLIDLGKSDTRRSHADLPSTRAPRPYQDDDCTLVLETLGDEKGANVFHKNAIEFYRPKKLVSGR